MNSSEISFSKFSEACADDKNSETKPRAWNPLSTDSISRKYSSYASFANNKAIYPVDASSQLIENLETAHTEIRNHVLFEGFACVGARSAFNKNGYRFGLYPPMNSEPAVRSLCHDLYEFCNDFKFIGDEFVTYIAMFQEDAVETEQEFEKLMWAHLQAMHDLDSKYFNWDSRVASEPSDNNFSFSIGERGLFVVGLHPQASRLSRRFKYKTLVFNPHEQFETLRERGKFESMKKIIRARDVATQGSINPVLKNFGESSEARQYSGRAVEDDWLCPFHTHRGKKDE
ncbi:YqcI/YcgG family protein [Paucibacter sp. TC2R-5]|uniref:guanitoxin biosynthesis heme-dependent pre-guanitoxin N-hydroxylase GntA n=1 Tax=Paucibacter sp. TC2R-5 TaxID=2893555 RepID=UPI0021E3CFF9|nr:guanitoxin biosynthesis heme-dependent pre-guanitoxin N-hydroxylase GntA [Paucibacter sp. TC2R-5]MCV2361480.1 YqcI/YcgG family protein [Paucibacter sp. TC2R-5]